MFRLVRYFSITSLVAFVIVAAGLILFYHQLALEDLRTLGESKNAALTQAFANSLWPAFEPLADEAPDLTTEQLQAHPLQPRLREAVLAQMQGLTVAKVKVYDLRGITIFSTQASQIGDDGSINQGFIAALNGEIGTELTHRDTFSAFEGTIADRDLISSYIPIRPGGPGSEIVGVMEVYDDVTPLLERIEQRRLNLALAVGGTLALLYGVLFLIVRRGEDQIRVQNARLIESEARLSAVLNTVAEGIITLAPSGSIVMFNQAAPELWGYDAEEFLSVNLRTLLAGAEARRVLEGLAEFDKKRGSEVLSRELELEGQRKGGQIFPLAMRIRETTVGDVRLFTLAVEDITERRRAADALAGQNRDLERANVVFRRTIEQMNNMIQSGANHLEMLTYLQLAQRDFERASHPG